MMHISHGPEETQKIAREQAQELTRLGNGQPLVIALEGELGAGKTTFTQAFAEALGVKESVKSPTFVLMKDYKLSEVAGYDYLYHLDCYRLNNSEDLVPLGVGELLERPATIMLIEWAERVKDILPRNHWVIHIDHVSEHERNISIEQIN